jgi:hypothetical protein
MCTVTIIAMDGGGFRLVTSRDESPVRPRAIAPAWRGVVRGEGRGVARGMWPVDGLAGGTWVAAAEHGLALTVLNGNPRPLPAPPAEAVRLSRGVLIPRLIGLADAVEAADALGRFELGRFEPFRLVGVDCAAGLRVVDSVWDGRVLTTVELGAPVCFASSGLGDHLVECRLPLFEEVVVAAGATPASQDEFHQHRWADRPELSVLMERAGARTVSITRAQVRPGPGGRFAVSMEHEAVGVGAAR